MAAIRRLALLIPLAALALPARADEGMWTFDDLPKDRIEKAYGFRPSDEWLRHLQLSAVRFNNGGSGSFVSPEGLLLTNHHVAADCIQKISTPERDLIRDGFLAATREQEVRCPDLELNVLVAIEQVTDKVNAAVTKGMNEADAWKAQREAMSRLEKACADETGLRCDVVTLYQGAEFDLYKYQRYTDVRLAFAPEFAIGFFGGDAENFTFPRYDLDMALFRAWENGAPAKPRAWLKWSDDGASDGELLFVAGHPGSTSRLLTVAQLEFLRDHMYPFYNRALRSQLARYEAFAKKTPEHQRIAQEDIYGLQNSLKARDGMAAGLRDPKLMAKKRADETRLRAQVKKLPDAANHAPAWDRLAAVQKTARTLYKPYLLLERPIAFPDRLFRIARTLVRRAEESLKPSEQRLREYRDSNLPSVDQLLFSTAPIYPELEQVKLTWGLEQLVRERGAGDALVKKVLKGRKPAVAARDFIQGTKLADAQFRRQLAEGGIDAIRASEDPMVQLALAADTEARAVRKRWEDEVEGPERRYAGQIARAQYELRGHSQYPDATFTLRLSYGVAKGYVENGKQVPWATTYGGLYQHATGKPPLALPPSFLRAKEKVDLATPLNFVSTNDIVGGNSGSPVVDKKGEVVGLIFDGNIQSLPNTFLYTEEQARAVSVHSAGILEALRKVYGAQALVEELMKPR